MSSSNNRQIFQADTPGRWNRFKWLSRALLIVLVCSVVGAALTITSKSYPDLPNLNPAPKKLTKKELENLKKTKKFQDFSLDKKEILEMAKNRREHQAK